MAILNTIRFLSVLCVALVMAAGLAHVLELPHKMELSADDYLVVQQIYRGWSLLGIPAILGAVLTGILALLVREQRAPFRYTLGAEICVVLGLAVFFVFTFPVNKETLDWTRLPEHWDALRRIWEYSHATGAALYFTAFVLLILSLLTGRSYGSRGSLFR